MLYRQVTKLGNAVFNLDVKHISSFVEKIYHFSHFAPAVTANIIYVCVPGEEHSVCDERLSVWFGALFFEELLLGYRSAHHSSYATAQSSAVAAVFLSFLFV